MESRVFLDSFTLAWEQRKLLDCVEKITDFRGRTPKKLGMDWSESGYLALSALNVKDGYIDFTQDVHYGDQKLYDKWMTGNELHKGQVLFTTEAPMGNVAQVPDNRRYILSQRTIAFSVKEDLITENFLATILRSPNVIATLTALSSGGTAKGVSQKSLSTVEIIIPNDLGEQERLANTFLELDHLITLHQCKCDYLIRLKYRTFSLLNKTAWEQRKVTDIGKIYIGLVTTMTKYYTDEGTLLIRNSDIKDGRFEFGNNPIYLENSFAQKNESRMHQLGDVVTVHTGDVGTSAVISENEVKSIGFATIVTRPNKEIIDSNYLCSFLNTEKHKKWAVGVSTGDGRTNYNLGDYFELVVPVPSIKEQQKIAVFIQKINHLITLHQRKPFCINRRQKWKQTTKIQNYSANIMRNGFQYIRKGR